MSQDASLIRRLGLSPADPKSPLPLYHQVYTNLSEIIRSGRLGEGDLLPPEVELAAAYGVGRQTVRSAIARMVAEGLLDRYAGIGTFVRLPANRMQFYLDRSFTQQMAEMGLQAHSQILGIAPGEVDRAAPPELQKKMGAHCLRLDRLRYGGMDPIGIQSTTIITNRCPDLERFDFAVRSLYEILSSEYRLPITEIDHVVSAVTANEVQSGLLQTFPGAPLLMVRTIAYLEDREPIEATTSYYRADRYEFRTTHMVQDCA